MHISLQDTDFVFFIDTQEWGFWMIWDVDQRAWVLIYKTNTFARLLSSPVLTRVTRSRCDHLPTLHVCDRPSPCTSQNSRSLPNIFTGKNLTCLRWATRYAVLPINGSRKTPLMKRQSHRHTNPTVNRAVCQMKMEQIHLHSFEAFLTQIWNEATNAKLEKLIICK